jgi:hypothetical protein
MLHTLGDNVGLPGSIEGPNDATQLEQYDMKRAYKQGYNAIKT